MATKKNSIKDRAKKVANKIKKVKSVISPIKREVSFTGSFTEHKDGSVFIFFDAHHSKEGNTAKNVSLSKVEVEGLKKFFNFLDLG